MDGEGLYLIIHLGNNNLCNRDGTERENSKTLIRSIISTWKQAKHSVIKGHVMDMVNSKDTTTKKVTLETLDTWIPSSYEPPAKK